MITIEELNKKELYGGYGVKCDAARLVSAVLTEPEKSDSWNEFWQELYHQADIGDASLAVIPILVQGLIEKNYRAEHLWAYVSSIEIVKGRRNNPDVPEWLSIAYSEAIKNLEVYSYQVASKISNSEILRYLFGFLLLCKGDFLYGRALAELTPDIVEETLENYVAI